MEQTIGRPRVARAYAWLIALATLVVILQGILFAGFYSEADEGYRDSHGLVGTIAGFVLILMIPLAFMARFPRHLQIGWLAVFLAVLWNVQAHIFGFGIEDEKWFEFLHIPVAFVIFAITLYLTAKTHRALKGRFD